MSGVLGYADPGRKVMARARIDEMAKVMSHREWYVFDSYFDETCNLALGRIGIGIFNKSPQPVWNSAKTIALVMAGEFCNQEELARKDTEPSDEAIALARYEADGLNFAAKIKGAFAIAIWDWDRERIIITNDRWGLYPTFYSFQEGRLVFGPEMKGVLCDPLLPRNLDLTALAQYMRFQQVLGVRTFFEEIRLLPGASVMTYDLSSRELDIHPYWDYGEVPHRPKIGFEEAVEETGRIFRQVIQRQSSDSYRPGVFLSGGLDSRSILGLVDKRSVVSLTFGAKRSRDVQFAERIARVVGSEHHWFDLPNGDWVKENADFHLELTEGFHDWIHMHGINILPQARQLVDTNLSGWDGGTLFGDSTAGDPGLSSPVDGAALTTYLFQLFNQVFTWPGLTESEERMLYTDKTRSDLLGRAFDSFREELAPYLNFRTERIWDYFFVQNHCMRMTINMVIIARSHIEVRCPFFDYDLFDFVFSLPNSYRNDRRLYRAVIQKEMPSLAYIPYDKDAFLPTTRTAIRGLHMLAVKSKWRFNRYIYPIFSGYSTLYADYEKWLREDLSQWAENILFDPRTIERNLFDPAFMKTLLKRHLSNQEEWTIGKIAPVMSYEMMLRRFYDA